MMRLTACRTHTRWVDDARAGPAHRNPSAFRHLREAIVERWLVRSIVGVVASRCSCSCGAGRGVLSAGQAQPRRAARRRRPCCWRGARPRYEAVRRKCSGTLRRTSRLAFHRSVRVVRSRGIAFSGSHAWTRSLWRADARRCVGEFTRSTGWTSLSLGAGLLVSSPFPVAMLQDLVPAGPARFHHAGSRDRRKFVLDTFRMRAVIRVVASLSMTVRRGSPRRRRGLSQTMDWVRRFYFRELMRQVGVGDRRAGRHILDPR